ncbi:MAG: PAS domain S-box protein [Reichenbachiella sp.]
MKKAISNYVITETLYESSSSLVYRGTQKQNNTSVILKVLQPDNPDPVELSRFQHEYEIAQRCNTAFINKVLRLEPYHNTLIIIDEDIAAESIDKYMKRRMLTLDECMSIAIQTAQNIGHIHAENVIHKNISPSNIIWNTKTGQVKIIDFGIASRLPKESFILKNPSQLEGTIAYLSPEQTGRINRSIDYRTDLYSLGVTLYEMFTGQLPFTTSDTIELVHCHIAKKPSPVCEINAEIPPIVSNIIMKLLEKNAEDRYQSALGVKVDLEKCQEDLENKKHTTDLLFELGQNDFSGKFQIPQKLYGRESEINILLETFDRVCTGKTEVVLVTGYSGAGKTALVHEVHKPMTEKRGYFIEGKFDQYKKGIPYFAITQAFNKFCRNLLMEDIEILQSWKNKILNAVGKNGQIIIDVIPDLELVIGKQPAAPLVGSTEEQNRFDMFFMKFIEALCNREHPIILFIDDLQWVDSASLALLKTIMLNDDISNLLIIQAYRDNEVDSNHAFIMMIDELQNCNAAISRIKIENLKRSDVNNLLHDSLSCDPSLLPALTNLCYEKTQGNAFDTHHFLHDLYDNDLLQFDRSRYQWHWNTDLIASKNVTSDVADLMSIKIVNLPEKTSGVLQMAACIGNQFNLFTLSVICELSNRMTLLELQDAIGYGLIIPESYEQIDTAINYQFKFLHDKVQQAAYSLIDEKQKKAVHLKIGRLLLKNTSSDALDEKIFDIVGHYNHSLELLADQTERVEIAQLNLIAGEKAKKATAYQAASQYLNTGVECLPHNCWQNLYKLTFELYKQSAECEYLLTRVERSEKLFEIVLDNAQTDIEKAEVYAVQIMHSMAHSKLEEAFVRGRKGLDLCGIKFPDQDQILPAIEKERIKLERILSDKTIETLIDEPEMSDEAQIVAMRIFPNLTIGSYLSGNNNAFTLSTLMSVNLTLTYGLVDLSAYVYAWYGVLLSSEKRLKDAYEFGKLALEISNKYKNGIEKSQTHNIVGTFLIPLNQDLKDSIPILNKGYQIGMNVGDIIPAIYCNANICIQMFAGGVPLPEVLSQIEKTINVSDKNKVFNCGDIALGYQQLIQFLVTGDEQYSLTDGTYSKEHLQRINSSNSFAFLMHNRLHKAFWFGKYKEALDIASKAEKALELVPGYIMSFEHYFLYPLVLTALYNDASKKEKEKYLLEIEICEQKLNKWAEYCPENFKHKALLVEAEKMRIMNADKAIVWYEAAIESAKQNNFIQNEALANERLAQYFLELGGEKTGLHYLSEAHFLYKQWGADGKAKDLVRKYPELAMLSKDEIVTVSNTKGDNAISPLDLESVLKASQVLSGEIVLSSLLKKTMHIVIENAGATRGLLILEKEGQWLIEAEGSLDFNEVIVQQAIPIEESEQAPTTLINYISRTRENVVLTDAIKEGGFTKDSYFIEKRTKSVLGMPLLNRGLLNGILYLENDLTTGAFTADRLQVIKLLAFQIGISLENTRLFEEKQKNAEELTVEVADRKQAEEELIESNEKYLNLMDNLGTGVVLHAADTSIILSNPMASEVLGISSEQMKGKKAIDPQWKFIRSDGTDLILEEYPVNKALSLKKSFSDYLVGIKHPDRNYITWLDVNASIVFDHDNNIKYVTISFNDKTERKQVEQALEESEGRFKGLMKQSPFSIQMLDTNGMTTSVNSAFENLWGINFEDLKGYNILQDEQLIKLKIMPSLEKAFGGEVVKIAAAEYDVKDTFGKGLKKWVQAQVYPIKDSTKKIVNVILVHEDITERKQAEEGLRESEEKYRELFENAPDGILIADTKSYYLGANKNMCNMLGYSREEIVGLHATDIVAPIEYKNIDSALGEIRSKNEHQREWIFKRKNGTTFIADVMVRPMPDGNLMAIVRDITDRKLAEEALRESEGKLAALFTSLTEMVVMHELVLNSAGEAIDYRIIDCNKVFTEVTGISKKDAIGNLASVVYQADPPPYLEEYAEVALGGDPHEFTTFYEPLNIHFMISVVSPQAGKFATITTDISPMMQIQEKIIAKNKEMENYLYIASHDLRSPLVNIQGFSQRLKKQADSIKSLFTDKTIEPEILHQLATITDEDIPNTLDFVFSNIGKMDTLINGLLQLSRTGRLEMRIQKIDMNVLFTTVLKRLDFQIKEAQCEIHIDHLPECYGDATLLDQVFVNLISNALKYSDSKRALKVTVEAKKVYNRVVYTVRDNGIGIAQKDLDKIWDVFFRIDPRSSKTGEGIGLSLVKRIAEKHKGKVWAESEENKGSNFHIELHNRSFTEL